MAAVGVPDVDVPMAALIAKAAVVAYQLLETGSESVKAALSSEIVCAELRRRSYVKVDTTVTHVSAAETLRLLDERLARLAPPTIEAEIKPVPAPRPTTSSPE